jgi:hypothetical protein
MSLGVTFDSQLRFDEHAIAVVEACTHHPGALSHIRNLLPVDVAKNIACSVFANRLGFTASSCSKTHCSLTIRSTNCRPLLLNQGARTDAMLLLQSSQCLPVTQRIKYKHNVALLTFKVDSESSPSYTWPHSLSHIYITNIDLLYADLVRLTSSSFRGLRQRSTNAHFR